MPTASAPPPPGADLPGGPAVTTIAALLELRRSPEAPALIEGLTGRSLSWAAVAAVRDRWADPMLPLRPGGRVGLLFSDPLDMAASTLGAIAAGHTVAPLNPAGTATELVAHARALGLGAVATAAGDGGNARSALRAGGVDLWAVTAQAIESAGGRTGATTAAPGHGAALVLATSGTTGRPKLIPLTEANLLHTARAVVDAHQLGPDDCGYSPLPLWHINGLVVGVLASLVGGHRLVVDRRFSASSFWRVASAHEATWLNLVPAIISVLAARPGPPAEVRGRVRFARSASAPLAVAALHRFEDRTGIPVVETYGMTEAASQITANPLGGRRPGSVGRPVAVDLRVVDDERHLVPARTLGQVEIRGGNVVDTYWCPADEGGGARPARTSDGWLATGDLGRIDDDGYVHLEGRADDVINRGGEKLHPREIEEVLRQDPDVLEAAVVARPHPTVGEEPVAFVVAAAGVDAAVLVAGLEERCAAALSRFRRPAAIEVVDAIPSGANGKIRRGELRRRVTDGA